VTDEPEFESAFHGARAYLFPSPRPMNRFGIGNGIGNGIGIGFWSAYAIRRGDANESHR
jgi:hypothetical protein